MVLQHNSMGNLYIGLLYNYFVQCQSRDFPTELCCNTIIHLLFHYFLLLGSLYFTLIILVCLQHTAMHV